MARRISLDRVDEDGRVASTDVSRLLVLGFIVAGALGFLIGLVWVVANLIRTRAIW